MISGAKSDQLLSCREILKDVFSFNATSLEKRLNVLLMAGHNVVTLLCSDLLFWHYSGQDEGSGCYATGGHVVFMLQTYQAVKQMRSEVEGKSCREKQAYKLLS